MVFARPPVCYRRLGAECVVVSKDDQQSGELARTDEVPGKKGPIACHVSLSSKFDEATQVATDRRHSRASEVAALASTRTET